MQNLTNSRTNPRRRPAALQSALDGLPTVSITSNTISHPLELLQGRNSSFSKGKITRSSRRGEPNPSAITTKTSPAAKNTEKPNLLVKSAEISRVVKNQHHMAKSQLEVARN
ncbi:hypothetical protein MRS44_006358 [Fusarium solani]|uniref:uncharacterized protein n=1 Tax=Fusarium solani TaxID=169388 RepID=UPI0032C49A34|nr:hypothetical protein MRS44_006358 [Fusarium solani]